MNVDENALYCRLTTNQRNDSEDVCRDEPEQGMSV